MGKKDINNLVSEGGSQRFFDGDENTANTFKAQLSQLKEVDSEETLTTALNRLVQLASQTKAGTSLLLELKETILKSTHPIIVQSHQSILIEILKALSELNPTFTPAYANYYMTHSQSATHKFDYLAAFKRHLSAPSVNEERKLSFCWNLLSHAARNNQIEVVQALLQAFSKTTDSKVGPYCRTLFEKSYAKQSVHPLLRMHLGELCDTLEATIFELGNKQESKLTA